MRCDLSFNNHLPNCICFKCGEARDMLSIFITPEPRKKTIKIRFKGIV